ncbi:putative transcription factor TIFY family [Helianthus annuus]|nr:putative transcription factor TIFY family [Helianthus annuus]
MKITKDFNIKGGTKHVHGSCQEHDSSFYIYHKFINHPFLSTHLQFQIPLFLSSSQKYYIMSSSSEVVDSMRYSGQNTPVRAPEKSSFSQTCNLFSQYLKENNTFPDLTLGRSAPQLTATMSLFPMNETPRATAQQANKQQDQSKTMTIFYNGQVMVFNDLAPEKVKEIMKLADQGSAHKPIKPDEPSKHTVVTGSDLPIARKASLARFLEKRKDRVTARSPYQVHDVSKQEDSKEWLGLGGLSH